MKMIFKIYLLVALYFTTVSLGFAHEDSHLLLPDLGLIDAGYLVNPNRMNSFENMDAELSEVVRVGSRALRWVDLVQSKLPISEREQIWRKKDRVGHEASPDSPHLYNREIVLERFNIALERAPLSIRSVLMSTGELSSEHPSDLTNVEFVDAIREIFNAYSITSRWIGLSSSISFMPKETLDFRPWLKLSVQYNQLYQLTLDWEKLDHDVKSRVVKIFADVCPLTGQGSEDSCMQRYGLNSSKKEIQDFFARTLEAGYQKYNERFGVRNKFSGAKTFKENGLKVILIPSKGITDEMLDWINARSAEAWNFKDEIVIRIQRASGVFIDDFFQFSANPFSKKLRVVWEKGALPHVNGVGGDTITMDANTPRWLEHTQIVMRHELGHVYGFTDCYTEFWDSEKKAITYYTLDPTDAMCALSGEYTSRHKDALNAGYFSNSKNRRKDQ